MNVRTKFEVNSFTHFWDNRGTQNIWAIPGYAHSPFSPKFFMDFCWDGPYECICQIWKSVALPFPEIILNSDLFLVGVANPESWRRGNRRWSGMVPFKRALMSFCRPSVVTFHLSLLVSVRVYCRCCAPVRHFFSPNLYSSPKFLHVLGAVGRWRLGQEERRCWANCPCS